MVGLMGLLQAVNVALQHNLTTQLRNEAVSVADEFLNQETSKTFDLISTPSLAAVTPTPVLPTTPGQFTASRKVSAAFKNYSVQRYGQEFSNSKQVNIRVLWHHKGVQYQHETMAVVSKNQ
jgi:type IV pilus assembly protein PilV